MSPVREREEEARASRRVIVVVMATTGLWAVTGGLFQPFLPLYIASIGGRATDVGLAAATSGVAFILAEALWGWASDRVGAARPLAISKLVTTAVFVGYVMRTEIWWIYLLQFVRGLSEVAMAPIGRALLAKHVAREGRGTVMGLYFTTQSLARSGTGIVGGGVVDALGFRALFLLCAVLSFAAGALAFFGLRRTADSTPRGRGVSASGQPGFVREFVVLSLIAGLGFWGQSGWWTFFPLYSATVLGLSASQVGLLSTIAGLTVLALTLPGGRLADLIGRKPMLIAGLVVMSLPSIAISGGFIQTFLAMATLSLVMAAGNAASNPARQALIADIAPAGRQGLAMGVYGVAEDVGILVGPLIGGLLWDRFGPAAAFMSFGAAYVTTAVAAAMLLREVRPRRDRPVDAVAGVPIAEWPSSGPGPAEADR